MKLIPVNEIPGRRDRHDLRRILHDFAESADSIVKIDFNDYDYKSAKVCYNCFWVAARAADHHIRVVRRGDSVYLTKN